MACLLFERSSLQVYEYVVLLAQVLYKFVLDMSLYNSILLQSHYRVDIDCPVSKIYMYIVLHSIPKISDMKFHLPTPHTAICTSTSKFSVFASANPEHCVHATWPGILDRDILHWLLHAPHVYMSIKRTRGNMLPICCPRK